MSENTGLHADQEKVVGLPPRIGIPVVIGAVSLAAVLSLVGGNVIRHKLEDRAINNEQPSCDISVQEFGGVSNLLAAVRKAGDNNFDARSIILPDGTVRSPNLVDSIVVQPASVVLIDKVNPEVCQAVGGTVDYSKA